MVFICRSAGEETKETIAGDKNEEETKYEGGEEEEGER